MAFHRGLMDLFPKSVGTAGPPPAAPPAIVDTTGLVMGYYDGNTVTALWNYAQHFAMSDNSYGTTFGPSTPGAPQPDLRTNQRRVYRFERPAATTTDGGNGRSTVISDADPVGDVCSTTTGEQVQMGGKNIGDLLNAAGVTWGWFKGGFDLTVTNPNGTTGCKRSTTSVVTAPNKKDYMPAPPAVPVLRVDRQPDARAPDVRRRDRPRRRRRESSVRPATTSTPRSTPATSRP